MFQTDAGVIALSDVSKVISKGLKGGIVFVINVPGALVTKWTFFLSGIAAPGLGWLKHYIMVIALRQGSG